MTHKGQDGKDGAGVSSIQGQGVSIWSFMR